MDSRIETAQVRAMTTAGSGDLSLVHRLTSTTRSAVGVMESMMMLNGEELDLSEQQLVDCAQAAFSTRGWCVVAACPCTHMHVHFTDCVAAFVCMQ
jgi:Papain family cysteine protease